MSQLKHKFENLKESTPVCEDELLRIRDNGAEEISRRGIPRWR